jgi:hypothetical protein
MESEDQKKNTYCHPTFTKLTAEQARKFVADYKTRNEEEAAADFFESLRKHPPNNATDQKRKRSA